MKKIILSLVCMVVAFSLFAQHPIGNDSFNLQTVANSLGLFKSKGALASDSGFVNAAYADTTAANRGNRLKNYPGALIRVGDSLWMRNKTATAWILQTGSGTAGGGGISQIHLAPIGTNPNANAATITNDSILNLELADLSFGGVVSASNTPQYFKGQKSIVVGTDTIFTGYSNTLLRTRLLSLGIQQWYLNSGSAEVGEITFSTPVGTPGIAFFNTTTTGRSQIRQYIDTGGIAIGSISSGAVIPGNQLVLLNNGHTFITGFDPAINTQVTDNGFLFNVLGTTYLTDKLYLGTAANGGGSDSVLVINNTEVKKVAQSSISGSITGQALTKTDDTNVTLTLGGSPSTALVNAASLTLGWTGALSIARGGTNNGSLSVTNQNLMIGDGTKIIDLAKGNNGQHLIVNGSGNLAWVDTAVAGASGVTSWSAGTTGFTPNSATTGAVILAGVLNETHGGTNQSSYTTGQILYASAANTLSKLGIGTTGQKLTVVGGVPVWQDTIITVKKAQLPLIISVGGDSISRRFNVMDYIPVGTNTATTDCTPYIQAAINAANAAGGGEVFFPVGIYLISGALQTNVGGVNMNSQLYIPYTALTTATRTHIKLVGESPINLTPTGTGLSASSGAFAVTSGVVLKSTNTAGTANSAVIGTGASSGFNYTYLTVENILIVVKNNPSGGGAPIGGINYSKGSSLVCKNMGVVIDTSGFRSTQPVNNVTGIETSDNGGEAFNNLDNTIVVGFINGYKFGEHVTMNQVQAWCCYRGINFKAGYHSSEAGRICTQWCVYDIYVSGSCDFVNLHLDNEWQSASKWYDDVATIKDSANLGHGTIFYHMVSAGVGPDDTKFIKSGGTNIYALSSRTGLAQLTAANTFTATNTFQGTLTASSTTNLNGVVTFGNTSSAFVAAANNNLGSVMLIGNSIGATTNATVNTGVYGYAGTNTATPSNYAGKTITGLYGTLLHTDGQAGGSATGFYTGIFGYGYSNYSATTPVATYGVTGESQDKNGGTRSTLYNLYGKGVRSGGSAVTEAGGLKLDSIPTSRVSSGSPFGVKQIGTNQINFYAGATLVGYNGGTTVNAAAQFEVASTTKGLLLPRMTKTQRDAIASPVAGLAIYQTDNTPGLRVYNGTNWMRFTETAD